MRAASAALVVLAAALAGCGGGGSPGSATPYVATSLSSFQGLDGSVEAARVDVSRPVGDLLVRATARHRPAASTVCAGAMLSQLDGVGREESGIGGGAAAECTERGITWAVGFGGEHASRIDWAAVVGVARDDVARVELQVAGDDSVDVALRPAGVAGARGFAWAGVIRDSDDAWIRAYDAHGRVLSTGNVGALVRNPCEHTTEPCGGGAGGGDDSWDDLEAPRPPA